MLRISYYESVNECRNWEIDLLLRASLRFEVIFTDFGLLLLTTNSMDVRGNLGEILFRVVDLVGKIDGSFSKWNRCLEARFDRS